MSFYFRTAEIAELDEIMRIYSEAQAVMEKAGNPQWQKGFPDKLDITGGILGGILYCVYSGGEIAAVFSVVNYDADYDKIEGEWLTATHNYLAVHRVAANRKFKGKGAAKYILNVAAPEIAAARGRTSIRMDTHEKNVPMRTLLTSQGFTQCGTIRLYRDLTTRVAFEKTL